MWVSKYWIFLLVFAMSTTVISSLTFSPQEVAVLSTISTASTPCNNVSETSMLALNLLYTSTNGSQWIPSSSSPGVPWFTGYSLYSNPCSSQYPWMGITCNVYCDIVGINLNTVNMVGTIPSELSVLTSLEKLQFPNNLLFGTLPQSLGTLKRLVTFDMLNNKLHGDNLGFIGNFTSLTYLSLGRNAFSGTLPPVVATLPLLSTLDLGTNLFTGSIPNQYFHNPSIASLYLNNNQLDEIDPNITTTSNLETLDLSSNLLKGHLPKSLISNHSFSVSFNQFHGDILYHLQNMTNGVYFAVDNNFFSGSFPANFTTTVHSLQQLRVQNNLLSGTIPSELATMESLAILFLDSNDFHGTIPCIFHLMPKITKLVVDSNHLTGQVCTQIWENSKLLMFTAAQNFLSDTFPTTVNSLQFVGLSANRIHGIINESFSSVSGYGVDLFDFSYNFLHGTIPPVIFRSQVKSLFLQSNHFTGSLASNFSDTEEFLERFSVSDNFLHGTIPKSLNLSINLKSFSASNCFLSGPMSPPFLNLPFLEEVTVSNNFLTGDIASLFLVSAYNAERISLAVDYNQLTGTIIPDVFEMFGTKVDTFISSVNCFTGTIPTSICQHTMLTQLLLEGLHTASSCARDILPVPVWQKESTTFSKAVGGSIPSCLLSLPNLEVLHLSGNHLTGTLPNLNTSQISKTLYDIILSHNLLSGTIPPAYLQIPAKTLDLSFNQLTGTIASDAEYRVSNGKLALQSNRLSGSLPSKWKLANNINILEGNLFSCESGFMNSVVKNLPENDPIVDQYSCGSSKTNIAVGTTIIFGCCLLFCVLCVLALQHLGVLSSPHTSSTVTRFFQLVNTSMQLLLDLQQWAWVSLKRIEISSEMTVMQQVMCFLQRFMTWYGVLTGVIIVVFMPIYAGISTKYGLYKELYIWAVSMPFVTGLLPAIVYFCFLWAILLFVFYGVLKARSLFNIERFFESDNDSDMNAVAKIDVETTNNDSCITNYCLRKYKSVFLEGFLVVLNIFIVLLVNGAFVAAMNDNQYTTTETSLISIAMSVFKIVWTNYVLMYSLKSSILGVFEGTVSARVIGFLLVFNNVLAPLLAEAFVNANCFRYAFTSPPPVTTLVESAQCYLIEFSKSLNESSYYCGSLSQLPYDFKLVVTEYSSATSISVNYQPGFIYNYTCSASLFANFIYVFIYRFMFSALATPLLWMVFKMMQIWLLDNTSYYAATATTTAAKSTQQEPAPASLWDHIFGMVSSAVPLLFRPLSLPATNTVRNLRYERAVMAYNVALIERSMKNPRLIEVETAKVLRLRLVSDIAVLLAFGVMFPPLAALIALSLLVDIVTSHMWITRLATIQLRMEERLMRGSVLQEVENPLRKQRTSQQQDNVEDAFGDEETVWFTELEVMKERVLSLMQRVEASFHSFIQNFLVGIRRVMIFVCLVWAFVLFDVMGGSVGARSGVAIFVLMVLSPIILGSMWWLSVNLSKLIITSCNTNNRRKRESASKSQSAL